MDYDITKAFNDGREHTCALLSQLVYTSDGEPMTAGYLRCPEPGKYFRLVNWRYFLHAFHIH